MRPNQRCPECGHRQENAADKRFDRAIDRILNSGLLAGYVDDFFRYVDGKITWEQFDERMSP